MEIDSDFAGLFMQNCESTQPIKVNGKLILLA